MKKKVLAVFLAAAVSCTMGAPAYGQSSPARKKVRMYFQQVMRLEMKMRRLLH